MSKKTDEQNTFFANLWAQAQRAAEAAVYLENIKLGPEELRGLDCGFAWLEMPGTIPFARWATKQGIGRKGYPSGTHIWYSKVHSANTQSVSVHEAACQAARNVLAVGLGEKMISVGSRLD